MEQRTFFYCPRYVRSAYISPGKLGNLCRIQYKQTITDC